MANNKLVVLTRDTEEYAQELSKLALPNLDFVIPNTEEETKAALLDANIIIGVPWMIKEHINDAKNVVWVQSSFAGIDALNDESLRKDYVLTNVKEVYGEGMAEYVFSYVLCIEKEIIENVKFQKQKKWNQKPCSVLQGKTLCIMGTGSIGKEIARIAKAFGMNVLGYRKSKGEVDNFDGIFVEDQLRAFLSQGDFVVNVLPSTRDTFNIINKSSLDSMKKNAILINIGRGSAVNEEDIMNAVKKKKIAKAVLDVFNEEPLSRDSPLWDTKNIYITPHVSGYIRSNKIFEIFAENYKRFVKGKELLYKVDFEKGY